jgi:hypothetical protein
MAKSLAEFEFRRLANIFMEPNDYEEVQLCTILYFARDMELLAE